MRNFARSNEGKEIAALVLDLGYRLAPTAGELTRPQIYFITHSLRLRSQRAYLEQVVAKHAGDGATTFIFEDDDEG